MDPTPTHAPRPQRPGAFSLIELMIVLSILTILVGVGAPALTDAVGLERLKAEGYVVGAHVYDSRMMALAIKRCIRVVPYSNNTLSAYGADANTLRVIQKSNANCECTPNCANITDVANYAATALPHLTAPTGFRYQVSVDATNAGFPVLWRPVGYLRGDDDGALDDNWVRVKVIDNRNRFVVVYVDAFGQICTGGLNDPNPSC